MVCDYKTLTCGNNWRSRDRELEQTLTRPPPTNAHYFRPKMACFSQNYFLVHSDPGMKINDDNDC